MDEQVLRALDHPNIIRLFEYGEDVENQKIHLLMALWTDSSKKSKFFVVVGTRTT